MLIIIESVKAKLQELEIDFTKDKKLSQIIELLNSTPTVTYQSLKKTAKISEIIAEFLALKTNIELDKANNRIQFSDIYSSSVGILSEIKKYILDHEDIIGKYKKLKIYFNQENKTITLSNKMDAIIEPLNKNIARAKLDELCLEKFMKFSQKFPVIVEDEMFVVYNDSLNIIEEFIEKDKLLNKLASAIEFFKQNVDQINGVKLALGKLSLEELRGSELGISKLIEKLDDSNKGINNNNNIDNDAKTEEMEIESIVTQHLQMRKGDNKFFLKTLIDSFKKPHDIFEKYQSVVYANKVYPEEYPIQSQEIVPVIMMSFFDSIIVDKIPKIDGVIDLFLKIYKQLYLAIESNHQVFLEALSQAEKIYREKGNDESAANDDNDGIRLQKICKRIENNKKLASLDLKTLAGLNNIFKNPSADLLKDIESCSEIHSIIFDGIGSQQNIILKIPKLMDRNVISNLEKQVLEANETGAIDTKNLENHKETVCENLSEIDRIIKDCEKYLKDCQSITELRPFRKIYLTYISSCLNNHLLNLKDIKFKLANSFEDLGGIIDEIKVTKPIENTQFKVSEQSFFKKRKMDDSNQIETQVTRLDGSGDNVENSSNLNPQPSQSEPQFF